MFKRQCSSLRRCFPEAGSAQRRANSGDEVGSVRCVTGQPGRANPHEHLVRGPKQAGRRPGPAARQRNRSNGFEPVGDSPAVPEVPKEDERLAEERACLVGLIVQCQDRQAVERDRRTSFVARLSELSQAPFY